MLHTPLDERYRFRFNIRPVKIVYFVWEDDWATLRRVLGLVCTQWGGIRNLVIPVNKQLEIAPIFEHLLKLCEPDWFVAYVHPETSRDFKEHESLQIWLGKVFPFRHVHLQIGDSFERIDHSAHAISVIREEDLSAKTLMLRKIDDGEGEDWLNAALFGSIYPGQEKTYADLIQTHDFHVPLGSTEYWDSQFNIEPFSSVLNLTGYNIQAYEATDGGIPTTHFEVVFVDSFNSLCLYWNSRAVRDSLRFNADSEIGRRIFLFPEQLLSDPVALGTFVEYARQRIPHPSIATNLHLHFRTWDRPAYEKLDKWLEASPDLEKFSGDKVTSQHHFGLESMAAQNLSGKKLTYLFTAMELPTSFREGTGPFLPSLIGLGYKRNEVLFDPPLGFRNRFGGSVAVDLVCDIWQRYPRNQQIAEAVKNGGWFSRYGLSMSISASERPTYFDFQVPTEWESLILYFQSKGYEIQSSPAGQYADAVVNLVGGFSNLPLIASKFAYLLVDLLALKSTKKISQRIAKELGNEDRADDIRQLLDDVQVIPELKGIPKSYRQLHSDERLKLYRDNLLDLLGNLCQVNVLKRGFYLPCPNCGAPDWYSLRELGEQLTCSGCGEVFTLPVESPKGSEIQWEYRLNTLVNRAVDQDVLPHILALYHATRERKSYCHTMGLALLEGRHEVAEFDFAFVSQEQLFAGECKAGTELGEKDMKTVELAAKIGVAKFYFCTVKTFSDNANQLIDTQKEKLKAEGHTMEIEILSGKELLGEPI